ncbi:ATP-binding protein [Dankookia rubra]|uniref:ATP-binding protein n=1 Tax=Dankookia rubra TaxID=1442381 RepID=A0A4R5QE99_9PROT|nr:ATP-binding protein [Dankookia rubra]TDH60988.1 ATP-binding protein [Dankookia rubra]
MLVRLLRDLFQRRALLPSVRAEQPVPDVTVHEGKVDQHRKPNDQRQRLANAFTPTRPLAHSQTDSSRRLSGKDQASFIGREIERESIIRALTEDRSHVAIFGDRGRGKTSLANHAVAQRELADFIVARYVCSATSNFDTIMRGLLRDLAVSLAHGSSAVSGNNGRILESMPPNALRPNDVLNLCSRLRDVRILLMVDEFDRVTDKDTRTAVADTIKHLSDRAFSILFMIIGASGSPEALLGRHLSIQRCVTRVALPLLTQAQVEHLVERGAAQAGLEFSAAARTCIAELARGVPYMAQLLSLRAGQAALGNGRVTILGGDLLAAIEAAAIEADPRILILYARVTDAERDTAALAALRAAAAGPQDGLGRFRVVPDGPSIRVAGLQVEPAAWHRVLSLGAIEAVHDEGPDLFTFTEAMLPHLVLLRALLARQAAAEPASPRGL